MRALISTSVRVDKRSNSASLLLSSCRNSKWAAIADSTKPANSNSVGKKAVLVIGFLIIFSYKSGQRQGTMQSLAEQPVGCQSEQARDQQCATEEAQHRESVDLNPVCSGTVNTKH